MKNDIDQLRFFSELDGPIVEHQELSELYILFEGSVMLGINVPGKGRINLNTIHPVSNL